jgi:hypothetical protein
MYQLSKPGMTDDVLNTPLAEILILDAEFAHRIQRDGGGLLQL